MTERFKLMCYENECGYIEYNKRNDEFNARLYDTAEHIPILLFDFDSGKFAEDRKVRTYLDDIIVPETIENIKEILISIGLNTYNKWEIYKRVEGRNRFDDFWIKPLN